MHVLLFLSIVHTILSSSQNIIDDSYDSYYYYSYDDFPIINGSVHVPQTEIDALVDLYQNNNGQNWICPWDITDIEDNTCKLYGVGCAFIENEWHITHLELPRCGLTGALTSTFSNLQKLSYLDLSYNFQMNPPSMEFPQQLRPLIYLRVIRLNNTGLNGTLPDWVFNLLLSIQYLDISYNNLTGIISPAITAATNLRSFAIHNNPLHGTIPMELYQLTYLKAFQFSNTNITGHIHQQYISWMRNLQMLFGANTRIKGPLPPALFELPSLRYLDLSYCNISGTLPNSLGKTPKLEYINLGGNALIGTVPANIYKLSNLAIVYLQNNKLNGTLTPLLFQNLPYIQMISFNNNELSGLFPAVPKNNLIIFDISNNNFYGNLRFFDEVSDEFTAYPNDTWICNLTVFYVNDNRFTSDIPINLNACNQLTTVSLHENSFSGLLPDFAGGNGTNITKLSLHNNNIKDDGLKQWMHILFKYNPYLQFLSIYGNQISGELSDTTAPRLRTFLAHDCLISGTVPDQFINNTFLVNITLFDNRLSCKLPKGLIRESNIDYDNTTVMFLLGNQFSTDKSNDLPAYINPDFGKAINLYVDLYEAVLQNITLYFALCGCIPFIVLYRLRKLYLKHCKDEDDEHTTFDWLFASSMHPKDRSFLSGIRPGNNNAADGGAYSEFRNKQNLRRNYWTAVSSLEDYQFFKEIQFSLNAISHWIVIVFTLWLIIVYGMNSTYYECANIYLHFSLAYMEGTKLHQTLIAISFVIGNTFILMFIFLAYRREKKQSLKRDKYMQPSHKTIGRMQSQRYKHKKHRSKRIKSKKKQLNTNKVPTPMVTPQIGIGDKGGITILESPRDINANILPRSPQRKYAKPKNFINTFLSPQGQGEVYKSPGSINSDQNQATANVIGKSPDTDYTTATSVSTSLTDPYAVNTISNDTSSSTSSYAARKDMILEEDYNPKTAYLVDTPGTATSANFHTPSFLIEDKKNDSCDSDCSSDHDDKAGSFMGTYTRSAMDVKFQAILFDKTSESAKHALHMEKCSCFSAMIYVFLWLFTLSTTVTFFVTISLPYNNTLKMGEWSITVIQYSLGFVLSICNIFVVPKISDYIIFTHIVIKALCCGSRDKDKGENDDESCFKCCKCCKCINPCEYLCIKLRKCCQKIGCCRGRRRRRRVYEHKTPKGYKQKHIFDYSDMIDDERQQYYKKLVKDYEKEEERLDSQLASIGSIDNQYSIKKKTRSRSGILVAFQSKFQKQKHSATQTLFEQQNNLSSQVSQHKASAEAGDYSFNYFQGFDHLGGENQHSITTQQLSHTIPERRAQTPPPIVSNMENNSIPIVNDDLTNYPSTQSAKISRKNIYHLNNDIIADHSLHNVQSSVIQEDMTLNSNPGNVYSSAPLQPPNLNDAWRKKQYRKKQRLFKISNKKKSNKKQGKSKRKHHYQKKKYMTSSSLYQHRSIITALLRSVNLIWIPFIVAIFFENDCGGGWSLFWDPCQSFYNGGSDAGDLFSDSELTVYLDLTGTQTVIVKEPTIFNLTDEAPVSIPYGSIAPMLTPDTICFDRHNLQPSQLSETTDCIRAVLSAWADILIIKMCVNIGVLFISSLTIYFRWSRDNLWLKIKPHVRMDKEYASILSHLEIAIVIGYIAPIIIPIIAVVVIVTIYFYKMSLKMGRDLRKSDLNFPMLFLCYPIIFQNFILIIFFHIANFNGEYILIVGFLIINCLFICSCAMLKYGYYSLINLTNQYNE